MTGLYIYSRRRAARYATVVTARGRTPAGVYRFRVVATDQPVLSGDLPDGAETAAIPIEGSVTPPINAQPADDLPPVVVEAVLSWDDIDAVLTDVTSTWTDWQGRPEWSEAEINVEHARPVLPGGGR